MAISVAMLYRSVTFACRPFSPPSFVPHTHVFHSHRNKMLDLAMRLFRDEYSGFRIDSTVFVRYRDVRVIPRHFVFCIRMVSREFPAHC